jgi:hypothetical protein
MSPFLNALLLFPIGAAIQKAHRIAVQLPPRHRQILRVRILRSPCKPVIRARSFFSPHLSQIASQ